jgi:hypothetical protein
VPRRCSTSARSNGDNPPCCILRTPYRSPERLFASRCCAPGGHLQALDPHSIDVYSGSAMQTITSHERAPALQGRRRPDSSPQAGRRSKLWSNARKVNSRLGGRGLNFPAGTWRDSGQLQTRLEFRTVRMSRRVVPPQISYAQLHLPWCIHSEPSSPATTQMWTACMDHTTKRYLRRGKSSVRSRA